LFFFNLQSSVTTLWQSVYGKKLLQSAKVVILAIITKKAIQKNE